MKLVKSLLLGSAAGLVAAAGAQAADLPSKKAAPVDYVRVCPASLGYGAGFFVIPGTETCLRVSGRVRAEILTGDRYLYAQDAVGFRARGQIRLDARTQTAYGTLRTFINYEVTNSGGAYNRGVNGTGPNAGNSPAGQLAGGAGASGINLAAAFIQFGPITAGRAQSFFDFYADALNYGPIRGSDTVLNMLAYTATFGGGFSATISLEDGTERRVGFAATDAVSGRFNPATGLPEVVFNRGHVTGNVGNYAGSTIPDVVANLNLTQGWGSVQLSGALHQVRLDARIPAAVNALRPRVSEKIGFALQGGLKLNLPMLAAGDVLYLQAAYAEGAISYLGYGGAGSGSTWGANSAIGEVNVVNADAVVDANGRVSLTKGFAVTAGLLHYWTPTIRQGIYGSYSQLNYGSELIGASAGSLGIGNGWYAANSVQDSTEIRLGTNLIWSPVAGLDIGVEVLYARVDPKGRHFSSKVQSNLAGGTTAAQLAAAQGNAAFFKGSADALQARFRIQRDF